MRTIELLRNYRNINRVYIPKGIYNENDERLFGLAEYLVANGHAVRLNAPKDETPLRKIVQVSSVSEDVLDLEDMTKAELEALAEERGIEVEGTGANGAVLKADLLKALGG